MKCNMGTAELYTPFDLDFDAALTRTTHMAVGAHQDDIEFMAYEGIAQCFQQPNKWFSAVIMTNGAGSPRAGAYADFTDEQMQVVRRTEQKKAAFVGDYSALALLDYPSSAIKNGADPAAVEDLVRLFTMAQPEVVYTHNLGDKHDTHVGVTIKVVTALRQLPQAQQPQKVLGCEVWRDLDWMIDSDKIVLDMSHKENLQAALMGVFDSQIAGGKRYDLATMGRRKAHATYHASHGVDESTGLGFAMDLTPLITDSTKDIVGYAQEYIQRFTDEITDRIKKLS